MRDHYSPGRRGQDYAFDDYPQAYNRPPGDSYHGRRDDYYDRRSPPPRDRYYNGYDARAPPPSYHPQPPPRNDRPRDYDRPHNSRDDQFTFRGAARGDSRRPQEEFSFRAPGPNPPGTFSAEQRGPPVPHKTQRMRDGGRIPGAQERRDRDSYHPNNGQRGGRGQDRGRGRGRGGFRGFGPKPAHNRDILGAIGREPTPEQMEGMNGGEARFRALSSSSEDEDESDDDSNSGAAPRKRTKVADAAAESSVPKWSNPDVYHLAPVPAENETVKRDLVEEIRKAKAEPVAGIQQRNDVAENADFISFGMDDDADTVASSSPAPPKRSDPPNFSHRDNLHGKMPSKNDSTSRGDGRPSFTPINGHTSRNAPPAPGSTEHGGPPPRPLGATQPIDSPVAPLSTTSALNRKRKHRDTTASGEIIEEWEALDGQDPTPWCTVDHRDTADTALRLHKEICDFFEFMSPRNFEEAARQDLIVRLQRSLRSWQGNGFIARNADVICFGSFASGLYLPTADMDVVAITPQYTQTGIPSLGASMSQLRKLAEHFTKSGMAKPGSATFIWGAKVPLVKFVDRQTGLKVDMSFENDSGYMALDTFKTWKSQYPAMPVLVAIIKQMLAMRGLNEVFNGGIGGFTTICLVVHVLQTMPELQAGSMDSTQHYGELLMKFLDLYGNKFNYHEVGIMMRHPYLFDKAKFRVAAKINMERLTIIDPNREDNDIAGGSRHIKTVFDCFRRAFNELQRELGRVHSGKINVKSILDCIIGGNYESTVNQRQRLQDLFGGHAETVSSLPPPPPPAPVASAPRQARPKSNPRNKAGKQQGQPAQSLQANNGKKARKPPPQLEIPEGASSKEARTLKTTHGKRMRAYEFKRNHPNVPNVPDMLSHGGKRKLLDKVGAGGGKRKK